ncbi:hypothetical protein GUJ93_ZPchr0014g46497 [Zizania palustris]|uniref:Peptidase S8/S53 domain-containing protein n=1 Tax=Zizania palustris TaxID=103762 RepID=A0A8J5VRS1_ZIZPA|nr:hypothetical protein GUJ93_ZPchr0014g46497 [Zizania palustris]
MKEFIQPMDYIMPLVLVTISDDATIQKYALAMKEPKMLMEIGKKKIFANYILISGTSMSSPYVVGMVALLRSAHPN